MTAGAANSQPRPMALPARKISPFASLREHFRMFVIIYAIMVILGLLTVWFMGPIYKAEAEIEVSPKSVAVLSEDKELSISGYRDFVQTQVLAIGSYEVVHDAVEKMAKSGVKGINAGEEREITEQIRNAIEIRHIEHTYRISVSLSGKKPHGLAETINMIAEAYAQRANQEKFIGKDVRVDHLYKRKIDLQSELRQLLAKKTSLVQELGVVTFQDELENPYDQMLVETNRALNEARQRRIEADAKLASLQNEAKRLENLTDYEITEDEIDKDPYVMTLTRETDHKKALLLVSIASLAESHPGVRQAKEKIARFNQMVAEAREEARKKILSTKLKNMSAVTQQEILSQTSLLGQLRVIEKSIDVEAEEHKRKSASYAALYNDALGIHWEIKRCREQLTAIDDRLDFFELEDKGPGQVRLTSPAMIPTEPEKGRRAKVLLFFLVMGLILGIAVPTAFDLLNPLVQSPADIVGLLGLAPLGSVINYTNKREKDFATEMTRRIALAILRQYSANAHRIFAIVSVKPGGGATSMTLDLTRELNNIGVRSLAVEANAYKPSPRFCAENENEHVQGFGFAMAGICKIGDCIVSAEDDLPERVPVGSTCGERTIPIMTDPRQLLTKEDVEIFLLDLPPILISSEAEKFARIADVVILVVEAEGVTGGEVRRAASMLKQIAPAQIGVVVNRVLVRQKSGYLSDLMNEYEAGENQSPAKKYKFWSKRKQ